MASAIELVDKADQEGRGKNKFEHVPRGQRGDLFLRVEDDDASSIATTDDYIGLELEVEMQRRVNRKRRTAACIMICMALAVVGGVAYAVSGSASKKQSSKPASSNSEQPKNPSVYKPTGGGSTNDDGTNDDDDGTTVIDLWPTAAPLPAFKMCPPPRVAHEHSQQGLDVFHIHNFRIVPESPTKDDYEDEWDYSVSSMDISDDASLIAVGMSDFSADTDYDVGLVRAFGYDCTKKQWRQVGQDLLGSNQYEMFGHRISSSKDGKTMAVSAPQEDYDQGNGFVEVYYLDENKWVLLGKRIENLAHTEDYSSLGHSINLSSKGETLAIMAVTDTNTYVIRVFYYDFNKKEWIRKGHDLKITIALAKGYDFDPQLSLSDEGDELAMADPQFGLIIYHFEFEKGKWNKADTKMPSWDRDDLWIGNVDMDDTGDIVAFTAFEESDKSYNWFGKVVDFGGDNATELYTKDFPDFDTETAVAVSDNGQVVALIETKTDLDDDADWSTEKYIGSMTLLTNQGTTDGSWRVIGKGTKAENIGIPGDYVFLSGNGKIAAVGSDVVVAIYGIRPNHASAQTSDGTDTDSSPGDNTTVPSTFKICAPFQAALGNAHAGDIDSLPKQAEEHTLSIAMSEDGSVVAVGIDSYDGEDRGMVRVFGWDCSKKAYSQMGQDLFGTEEFDGFGQSVALASDGKTLVVGANQPPPGRSGYVEVYSFGNDGAWKIIGKRLNDVESLVEDLGREVLTSDDGKTVTFLGSIVEEDADGWHDTSSFVRTVVNDGGKWKPKGDDLIASIEYDDYGSETHIALSGDGTTLAVTGSYSSFMAKVYTFNEKKSNWTELIIPPIKTSDNDDVDDEDCLDDYFDNYFSGSDIALNNDGSFLAISGSKFDEDEEIGVVRVLSKNATSGNFTLSRDPVDYWDVWTCSSVGITSDGKKIAVGINSDEDEKGALFVTGADDSDSGWNSLGKVDGREEDDLLGSRVTISRDGTVAAASSRKGYVSFFKLG